MSALAEFQKTILGACVALNKEQGDGPILTGETDLDITKTELLERIRKNKNGEGYVDALQGESQILVRQGLFEGCVDYDKHDYYFKIPNWDQFISAIDAFYVACYAPGCDDEDEECEP